MIKVSVAILALPILGALLLFWIHGIDTYHASRSSIWWTERGRNLIPPTAADNKLRKDLLDHPAIYTMSESDLDAFLDQRFARRRETLDSFRDRIPANPSSLGDTIGSLDWKVTKDSVPYSYVASNGGVHHFSRDTKTGLTFQSSAYW